jgi:hypothetical protein
MRYARCALAREYGGLLDNRSLRDFGSENFLCQRTNRTTIITRSLFCNEPSDRGKIKSYTRNARFGSIDGKARGMLVI